MQIRTATSADLAAVVQIEAECFPAAEAATELSLARRLALYLHRPQIHKSQGSDPQDAQ